MSYMPNEILISATQPLFEELWVDTTQDTPPNDWSGADARFVNTAGDAMTGALAVPTIGGAGGNDLGLSTHIAANGKTIWGLRDPPLNSDWACTKGYADGKILYGTAAPTGTAPAGTIYCQY